MANAWIELTSVNILFPGIKNNNVLTFYSYSVPYCPFSEQKCNAAIISILFTFMIFFDV